jgi:hypothetical protein
MRTLERHAGHHHGSRQTAGNYEIRYVYGATGQTLSSTPIQIK